MIKATVKNALSHNPALLATTQKVYRTIIPYHSSIKLIKFDKLYSFSLDFAKKLPNDFDVIIGVPRSGLIVGNLLANAMGKPLTTPDLFLQGQIWYSKDVSRPVVKKVLVVEDVINSGRALRKAVSNIRAYNSSIDVKTASLFVTVNGVHAVDYCYAVLNDAASFEWGLLSSPVDCIGSLAVDFDGVLCHDCIEEISKNRVLYEKWLDAVEPYLIPTFEIEAIITARLEKYRPQTERWLKKYGVKYKRLIMLDLPNEQSRTFGRIIRHKVSSILEVKPRWYWESSFIEARAIHFQTKLPVLCTQYMKIV